MIDYDRLVRSITDWKSSQRPGSGVFARAATEADAAPQQPYDAVESGMLEEMGEVESAEIDGTTDVDVDPES